MDIQGKQGKGGREREGRDDKRDKVPYWQLLFRLAASEHDMDVVDWTKLRVSTTSCHYHVDDRSFKH